MLLINFKFPFSLRRRASWSMKIKGYVFIWLEEYMMWKRVACVCLASHFYRAMRDRHIFETWKRFPDIFFWLSSVKKVIFPFQHINNSIFFRSTYEKVLLHTRMDFTNAECQIFIFIKLRRFKSLYLGNIFLEIV